jgi:hypothetical protein
MLAQLVPELALARVVTAGGPYRPGDEISLAFMTPTVSRLVAHDAELRAKCAYVGNALIPEMISVLITHAAAPYEPGDVLTLSFVDPRVARVYTRAEHSVTVAGSASTNPSLPLTNDAAGATGLAISDVAEDLQTAPAVLDRTDSDSPKRNGAQPGTSGSDRDNARTQTRATGLDSSSAPANARETDTSDHDVSATAETGRTTAAPSDDDASHGTGDSLAQPGTSDRDAASDPGDPRARRGASAGDASDSIHARTTVATGGSDRAYAADDAGTASKPLRAGERMTLAADAVLGLERRPDVVDPRTVDYAERRETADRRGAGISLRLDWNQERLRRFVQVVDKLFTIDRLGWYRHSLAMRLLIPDEIASDDTLANVEAMRHLHALRAAAVESLGKPLLAACMPGFRITSEWLESLESSREARAIAGLRDALLPYASDDESIQAPPADATFTLGTLGRRQLLAESATSVEAFLPLLIATVSHDAALSARLSEYRRLLVELFAQTARAGEPVRLHQMAQPNHSLDDRLWQLVGAAGEAFGGFAPA